MPCLIHGKLWSSCVSQFSPTSAHFQRDDGTDRRLNAFPRIRSKSLYSISINAAYDLEKKWDKWNGNREVKSITLTHVLSTCVMLKEFFLYILFFAKIHYWNYGANGSRSLITTSVTNNGTLGGKFVGMNKSRKIKKPRKLKTCLFRRILGACFSQKFLQRFLFICTIWKWAKSASASLSIYITSCLVPNQTKQICICVVPFLFDLRHKSGDILGKSACHFGKKKR